jgi:hypothetical protein
LIKKEIDSIWWKSTYNIINRQFDKYIKKW